MYVSKAFSRFVELCIIHKVMLLNNGQSVKSAKQSSCSTLHSTYYKNFVNIVNLLGVVKYTSTVEFLTISHFFLPIRKFDQYYVLFFSYALYVSPITS